MIKGHDTVQYAMVNKSVDRPKIPEKYNNVISKRRYKTVHKLQTYTSFFRIVQITNSGNHNVPVCATSDKASSISQTTRYTSKWHYLENILENYKLHKPQTKRRITNNTAIKSRADLDTSRIRYCTK